MDAYLKIQDHFRKLEERLRARPVPTSFNVAAGQEAPDELVEMGAHLDALLLNPDFPFFFAFMRQKAADLVANYHPSVATESELRYAATAKVLIDDMAAAVVKYAKDVQEYREARRKYLEDTDKKKQNPTSPQGL